MHQAGPADGAGALEAGGDVEAGDRGVEGTHAPAEGAVRGAEPDQASRPVAPAAKSAVPASRRRLVFGIVSIALFMVSVDQTIVATALHAIQHGLHAQITWAAWTITIYALGQIVVRPFAGRLSDQHDRKKVFLAAVAIFTGASLCCGVATNVYLLVVLRAVQAVGGGGLMPTASGIVSEQFGQDRDRALGLFSSIFPIGGLVGPILGGVFVTFWSWRGIFLVNVPIGIVLIVLVVRFVPHSRPTPGPPVDFRGAFLLAAAILAAMLGITYLGSGDAGFASPVFLVCELAAVAAGTAFVRHTRRHAAPIIPARFLFGKGFGVMNLVNFVFGASAFGFSALVPLYAENRYGVHVLQSGTLLSARAVGAIVMAALGAYLLRRTGYRIPMITGYLVLAAGQVLMFTSPHGLSPFAWLAMAAACAGAGVGFSQPGANNASLHLAPDNVASIAGLRGMFRQSGGIMAVAVTTAILNRSADPGIAQAHVFLFFAFLIVAATPLILLVPDHRGRW